MLSWIKQLDQILRGEKTQLSSLREGSIEYPLGGITLVIIVLGLLYGGCMGTFAMFRQWPPSDDQLQQLLASTVKVPLLFLMTLVITFPSLYVFNALIGSRLFIVAVLRLLIASLGVTLAMLASLGPIVVFFSVSTTSYGFMVLLNVFVFGMSGLLGLKFLLQTLHRLTVLQEHEAILESRQRPPGEPAASEPTSGRREMLSEPDGPLSKLAGRVLGAHVKVVFRCWVVVFGLVGAQMGWVLRPFIGNPEQPFEWFRTRESHFFAAVWQTLRGLIGM